MAIQCDHVIRRPDIVVHEKEGKISLHLGITECIKRRVKRLVPRFEEGDWKTMGYQTTGSGTGSCWCTRSSKQKVETWFDKLGITFRTRFL